VSWRESKRLLGIPRVALGSLSEAARVFDAAVLHEIVTELALRAVPLQTGREAEALRGLTAVDGSVLRALPRMVWALAPASLTFTPQGTMILNFCFF
jgi:hypothetical protein